MVSVCLLSMRSHPDWKFGSSAAVRNTTWHFVMVWHWLDSSRLARLVLGIQVRGFGSGQTLNILTALAFRSADLKGC